MDDFNSVRTEDERFGCLFNPGRAAGFNAFISASDLQELHMGCRRFTWVGPGGMKLSKLDRFLLSRDLNDIWTSMSVVALDCCFVDHCPILLKTSKADFGPTPLWFFNQWLQLEGFNDMVRLEWNSSQLAGSLSCSFKEKLKMLKTMIKVWREQNSDAGVKVVREAKAAMLQWDCLAEQKMLSEMEAAQFKSARVHYFNAYKQLSLGLKHKSRVKWALEGDENSRFFQGLIKGRLKQNMIRGINMNGEWLENPAKIKEEIFKHYSTHFREPAVNRPRFVCARFKQLADHQVAALQVPFTEVEVKNVV